MLNKRNYNVLFHTHTVSGITISVLLYVIFFAGAFALFKDEITAWEKGTHLQLEKSKELDLDRLIETIRAEDIPLYGRDIRISYPDPKQAYLVRMNVSQDTCGSVESQQFDFFKIDALDYTKSEYYDFYSFGELIYRLHFFSQIPTAGIYIAGLTAFFFLFAIITGILIHWKKIVSNFYQFRPLKKWKTIWTDAHTALGVIGLPFQFVYAITSCFLCLNIFVLLPANFFMDGDREKLINEILPANQTYTLGKASEEELPSLNDLLNQGLSEWENFDPSFVWIRNFGAENMKLQVDGRLESSEQLLSTGRIIYEVYSGEVFSKIDPKEPNFTENFYSITQRLHFADYGGLVLKFVYFIMALITCFVIITGVLIWLEARDKKNLDPRQRRFNHRVGHIYLAICLSIFPVTGLSLLFGKFIGSDVDRFTILYIVFFGSWLLSSLFFSWKKDNYLTNKWTLLTGAVLFLLVPVSSGLLSGNWLWSSFALGQYELFIVDLIGLGLGALALFTLAKLKRKRPNPYLAVPVREKEPVPEKSINFKSINKMQTRLSIYWLFLAVGWVIHHLYGVFSVYYFESVMMEGATGETPLEHHLYRIAFEGMALLFALLSLELEKKWFKWASLIWAGLSALYNAYHLVAAIAYDASNISELFILLWMLVLNIILVVRLKKWSV